MFQKAYGFDKPSLEVSKGGLMKFVLSMFLLSLISLSAWSQQARVLPQKPVNCSNYSGLIDTIFRTRAQVVDDMVEVSFYLQRGNCHEGEKEVLPMLRNLALSFFPSQGIAGFSFKSPSYEYMAVNEKLSAVKLYLPLKWLEKNDGELSYIFVIRHYDRNLKVKPTRNAWNLDLKLQNDEVLVQLK